MCQSVQKSAYLPSESSGLIFISGAKSVVASENPEELNNVLNHFFCNEDKPASPEQRESLAVETNSAEVAKRAELASPAPAVRASDEKAGRKELEEESP